jgi:phosphoglycolate phosphatase
MIRKSSRLSIDKVIIFDLDGTLIDAYQAIEESFNFTMRKLGLPRQSPTAIRKAVGWGDKKLLVPFVSTRFLAKALKIYRENHKKTLLIKARLFPGARQILTKLSGRCLLAVASNRPTLFSHILLRSLKIRNFFDYVICADRLNKAKPHPLILKTILSHFCIKPQQALYIGDMAIDAQTARRAHIKSIIVTTGSSSLSEIKKEKPYRIISSIRQLDALCKYQAPIIQ